MCLRFLKYLWALPTTALGLLLVPLAIVSRGQCSIVDGVLELHGGLVSMLLRRCIPLPGGAAAMTLGHVVLGRDQMSLARTRPHERAHVRQCERWGGLFVPAYLACSLWLIVQRREPYFNNYFEREADKQVAA